MIGSLVRLWYPTDWVALGIDIVVLTVWGIGVGYLFARLPLRVFDGDGVLTRLRPWERGGRAWERVGVRRWKRWLPDAGDLFGRGFSKTRLARRDLQYLDQFVAETRRAELVHWIVPAIGPIFYLWNPWWLATVMVAYGLVANVPCLVTQRYNRGRLLRMLARRRSRPGPRN